MSPAAPAPAQGRRAVDLAVISDLHLGSHGCHAEALLDYLGSIDPGRLVLNGDVLDIWQFDQRFWPASHQRVVDAIIELALQGRPVHYLCGNHDDFLRRFGDFQLGPIQLGDELRIDLDGQRTWILHGDRFDPSVKRTQRTARLGSQLFDQLLRLERRLNERRSKRGRPRHAHAQGFKQAVKRAVKAVSDFEHAAAIAAIRQDYDVLICGHVHLPQMREVLLGPASLRYLNSGDWTANLSALEYHAGSWRLYRHPDAAARRCPTDPIRLSESSPRPAEPPGPIDLVIRTGNR